MDDAITSGPVGSAPGTSGPGTSGPVGSGPGTSGPGTSGPGTSGPGTSGPGTSGPGTSGPGTSALVGSGLGSFGTGAQIGEGFVGAPPHVAHINTVLGRRGGPVETAWATALATPRAGHVPFVCVLRPNLPVQPMTLFVNKAAIANDLHGTLTWGAAQAGVAAGVADAVADGVVDTETVGEQCLIVAVWVDPGATDESLVYAHNREATALALAAGARNEPSIGVVLVERDRAWNPYFRQHLGAEMGEPS